MPGLPILQIINAGVMLATNQDLPSETFDLAVIATGHVWPDEEEATRTYFPSPWSGLMEAKVDACNVGIMGTSLSGLDAAMAVAIQHGSFIEDDKQHVIFHRDNASEKAKYYVNVAHGYFYPKPISIALFPTSPYTSSLIRH